MLLFRLFVRHYVDCTAVVLEDDDANYDFDGKCAPLAVLNDWMNVLHHPVDLHALDDYTHVVALEKLFYYCWN